MARTAGMTVFQMNPSFRSCRSMYRNKTNGNSNGPSLNKIATRYDNADNHVFLFMKKRMDNRKNKTPPRSYIPHIHIKGSIKTVPEKTNHAAVIQESASCLNKDRKSTRLNSSH